MVGLAESGEMRNFGIDIRSQNDFGVRFRVLGRGAEPKGVKGMHHGR